MSNKYRCFADKGSYCSALTEKQCEYGGCSFYKTEQKVYDENELSDKKIQEAYGITRREYIHKKYYRRRSANEVD